MSSSKKSILTKKLFEIRQSSNGKYYAIRTQSPKFSFEGDTIIKAVEAADAGLNLYYDYIKQSKSHNNEIS